MQKIPRFSPLYLSEYLQFWQGAYKEALGLQEKEVPEELVLEREEAMNKHLMRNFDKLRNIVDDDYFEWNQAMCVFLCLCQWRVSAKAASRRMLEFCKKTNLLEPRAERLSQAILLLKHLDQRWAQWDLKDFEEVEKYVQSVHRTLAPFVVRAGSIQVMDRWNFLQAIDDSVFRLHPKGIFYVCSHVCLQLKSLELGRLLRPILQPMQLDIEQADRDHFYAWAEQHGETYYSIRTFRMRISSFVWLFMHDEATRCYHTYSRAGEIPTIYAHVTSKYPSGFIGNLQHDMLYSEALDLIRHENPLIRDANFLALFEASIKTLYSVDFIKYCFCHEHSIVDLYKKILQAEHPILVRVWGRWGVIEGRKFYYSKGIIDSLLLWLHMVKKKYNCILMKSFNITNLVNQCTRINKAVPATRGEPAKASKGLYEVCL